MVSNPHFYARNFYVPIEHPEMGVFPYPGLPWLLSGTPATIRAASPLYGEHNSLVFRDLLVGPKKNSPRSTLAEQLPRNRLTVYLPLLDEHRNRQRKLSTPLRK